MLVMVAGLGKSGISSAALLLKGNDEVLLFDSNENIDRQSILNNFDDKYKDRIHIVLGKLSDDWLRHTAYCVISPGIDLEADFAVQIREAGIPIWSEIELGYKKSKGDLIAITGTNGKTTTTALVGQIMKRYRESCFVAGNIGIPYTDIADSTDDSSVTVLETSSFQLETVIDFRPKISAILNITPDHLNRHHTMNNYIKIKEDITKNQDKSDICVLNYEDNALRDFAKKCPARVCFFSSREELSEGFYLKDHFIVEAHNGKCVQILDIKRLNVLGRHNYENVMAAAAIAKGFGVPDEVIREACYEFQAVEHRIEFVREVHGVRYYNDSKGTNPDAAIQAILAMPSRTYLIAGGYDKGSDYDEWIESFDGKVAMLILMGATAEKIAEAAKRQGFDKICFAYSMEEAVDICAKNAKNGEYVLLSPACASWGMFKNYEERGRIFKECVRRLE